MKCLRAKACPLPRTPNFTTPGAAGALRAPAREEDALPASFQAKRAHCCILHQTSHRRSIARTCFQVQACMEWQGGRWEGVRQEEGPSSVQPRSSASPLQAARRPHTCTSAVLGMGTVSALHKHKHAWLKIRALSKHFLVHHHHVRHDEPVQLEGLFGLAQPIGGPPFPDRRPLPRSRLCEGQAFAPLEKGQLELEVASCLEDLFPGFPGGLFGSADAAQVMLRCSVRMDCRVDREQACSADPLKVALLQLKTLAD
eukprot:1161098-Pelagomonas_calceolata.AAC.9